MTHNLRLQQLAWERDRIHAWMWECGFHHSGRLVREVLLESDSEDPYGIDLLGFARDLPDPTGWHKQDEWMRLSYSTYVINLGVRCLLRVWLAIAYTLPETPEPTADRIAEKDAWVSFLECTLPAKDVAAARAAAAIPVQGWCRPPAPFDTPYEIDLEEGDA